MTRIDAHQHFWRFDPVRDAWITSDMVRIRRDFLPPDLEPELRASGMDGCVAVQADQSEDETRFLLDLAHRHDFVRGIVGWVNLLSSDLDSSLARLSQDPLLKGVRHIAQAEADDFLGRNDVIDGIARLRDFGLAFDVLVYERQLPAAIDLAERLPDQPLVLDHLGKPRIREGLLEPWATHLRELGRHGNVWCKVSGMVTEADWKSWRDTDLRPYLDVAFEAFGSGRLMFGSDWPVCLLAGPYGQVSTVVEQYSQGLAGDERNALFGGNASRFYSLDEKAGT
ncbi:MAG: amidohydrolase family protein [Gemmatimonadetes bacterium]|nr:amidohydrolase family protein [Gemmatimonadota bacterium]